MSPKIQYFSIEPYKFGRICANYIFADAKNIISINNKTIIILETYEDNYGETREVEHEYFLRLEDAKNKLIKEHKEIIKELTLSIESIEKL